MITYPRLYVPVAALSINDNIDNIKQKFKRKYLLNKQRSEITAQPKSNNLDYTFDSTFIKFYPLFTYPFKVSENDPMRNSFTKYYMPLVEIKDFDALTESKSFLDQPVKE